jgi:hypothetical protein
LLALSPEHSRIRLVAAGIALTFHAANAALFSIGTFPPMMAAALTLWFGDDAEERSTTTSRPKQQQPHSNDEDGRPSARTRGAIRLATAGAREADSKRISRRSATEDTACTTTATSTALGTRFAACFVLFNLVWPLRRFASATPLSDPTWGGEGYLGSWLMKLHQTDGQMALSFERAAACALPDESHAPPVTLLPQLDPWLTPHQRRFVGSRPSSLLQYVHHRGALLAAHFGGAGCVRAFARPSCFSHNGHPPQPLYDPAADLMTTQYDGRAVPLGESGVGAWIRPLSRTAAVHECEALLVAPVRVVLAAEDGFAALRRAAADGSSDLDENQPLIDEARARWFWHSIELLRKAALDGLAT